MLRSTSEEQIETEGSRKDVELTLGPTLLFALVCGLLLVCGLCFGVGYTSGRRNGLQTMAAKAGAAGKTLAEQAAGTGNAHKPTATGAAPAVQAAVSQVPVASPAASPDEKPPAAAGTPAVRAALAPSTAPGQADPSNATTSQVQPALGSANGIMVQIAAVSRMEDANVLMAALIKRGYAVTARRETGDNLIHVQIGPFATGAEANAMSEKLLNDGYNAVVMQ